MISQTPNGSVFAACCRGEKAPEGARPRTTAASSTPCSGFCGRARRGGICRQVTADGRTRIAVSRVGGTRGSGKGSGWRCAPKEPPTSLPSMAVTSKPTPTLPAHAAAPRASPSQKGAQHETSPRRRRLRKALAHVADGRQRERLHGSHPPA